MHFEQYYNKIENVLKNHYFSVSWQKNADVIEFTIGQAICIPRFMTLAKADQILDREWTICPLPRAVVSQKGPGQIGLKFFRHAITNSKN